MSLSDRQRPEGFQLSPTSAVRSRDRLSSTAIANETDVNATPCLSHVTVGHEKSVRTVEETAGESVRDLARTLDGVGALVGLAVFDASVVFVPPVTAGSVPVRGGVDDLPEGPVVVAQLLLSFL